MGGGGVREETLRLLLLVLLRELRGRLMEAMGVCGAA
jgi:hypothetical protein